MLRRVEKFDASHMLTAKIPAKIRAEIARMSATSVLKDPTEGSPGMSVDQVRRAINQINISEGAGGK